MQDGNMANDDKIRFWLEESGGAALEQTEPSHADLPRYAFKTLLREQDIRVLTIRGVFADHVECSIRHIRTSQGGYQALSYVWGSEEQPFRAVVRNHKGKALGYIPLTKNVNDALHDLWNAREVASKVFWIDQICINQTGGEEKNHQVALMGEIYKHATRVITYVGPAEDQKEDEEGIQQLQRLSAHFEEIYPFLLSHNGLNEAGELRTELPTYTQLDNVKATIKEKTWRWLAALCFGEWATRLWMVQERVLNAENVMLRGSYLLSWDAVATLPSLFFLDILPIFYATQFWSEKGMTIISSPWAFADSLFVDLRSRRSRQDKGNIAEFKEPLLGNMLYYKNLQCRDPRDTIFAMIAISSDITELSISPDYSKSIARVLLEATVALLQHDKSTKLYCFLLTCLADNLSDPTHPSWALHPRSLAHPEAHFLGFGIWKPHPNHSHPAPPRFLLNMSVLVLRGRILDRISYSSRAVWSRGSVILGIYDKNYIDTLGAFASSLSLTILKLGITLENAAALFRVLVANSFIHSEKLRTEKAAHIFWCFLCSLATDLKEVADPIGADFSAEASNLFSFLMSLATLLFGDDAGSFPFADKFSKAEYNIGLGTHHRIVFNGRSFCVTEQNRFCNGMNQVVEGDVIAALEGADRLYILRPYRGRYRLVGDAYVDGLMKGESFVDLSPDEISTDIELV